MHRPNNTVHSESARERAHIVPCKWEGLVFNLKGVIKEKSQQEE